MFGIVCRKVLISVDLNELSSLLIFLLFYIVLATSFGLLGFTCSLLVVTKTVVRACLSVLFLCPFHLCLLHWLCERINDDDDCQARSQSAWERIEVIWSASEILSPARQPHAWRLQGGDIPHDVSCTTYRRQCDYTVAVLGFWNWDGWTGANSAPSPLLSQRCKPKLHFVWV